MATSSWRTLKFFISSTFLDLELERDKLNNIFRYIENQILDRKLVVRPYDLRWMDRSHNDPIADWCINMVKQCEYFVGILGTRYGWRPPLAAGGNENNRNISITEMEIEQALLSIDKQKRFFCFDKKSMSTENENDQLSMQNLKQKLVDSGEKIYYYENREELLSVIGKECLQKIDEHYPLKKTESADLEEQNGHSLLQEIINEKTKIFVGRNVYIEQIKTFARDNNKNNYLAIVAHAGTGKSSLLAKFIQDWDESIIISHYMSMANDSRDSQAVIMSLAQQLRAQNIITEPLALEPALREAQLQNALHECQQKIVIAIDGLDEMVEKSKTLSWLPKNVSENIRIILTVRPVDPWPKLQTFANLTAIELPPLDEDEINQIIDCYSKEYGLNLSSDENEILRKRAAGNPLFLKVALDEIATSGIAVGQLALTVDQLFEQILQRIQKQFGEEIITNYLGIIAASRQGILEKELADILNIRDEKLLRITQTLNNFVVSRRGLLDFFHPEFERTIMKRFGRSGMRMQHSQLANYLQGRGLDYLRALEELPYQLQWGEKHKELLILLTNLEFLEKKCLNNMVVELVNDFTEVLENIVVPVSDNLLLDAHETKISKHTIFLLKDVLSIDIQFLKMHPQQLFQTLWNNCYWHDNILAEKHYHLDENTIAPWNQNYPKISELCESWRKQKEQTSPSVWLKALRPLPSRLGTSLKLLSGHSGPIESIKYSPDGNYLASGGWDRSIRIWDAHSGETMQILSGHEGWINGLAFGNSNKKLASASRDNTVRIWDLENNECIKVLSVDAAENCNFHTVCFSPDEKYVVAGGNAGTFFEIDVESGAIHKKFIGHEKVVYALHYNHDATKVMSCSSDATVRIWDRNTSEVILTISGHASAIQYAKFNSDSTKIVSGSKDRTIRIWDAVSGEELQKFETSESIYSTDFSHDGTKVLGCGQDRIIHIIDVATGKELQKLKGHPSNVICAKFSPNDKQVASGGGADVSVRLWNLEEFAKSLDDSLVSHSQKIEKLSFSLCGKYLATGARDGVICLWNAQNGILLNKVTAHQKSTRSVAFSPCGEFVISASLDKTVKLWKRENMELVHVFEEHNYSANSACFDVTGKKILSVGGDKKIIIRDAKTYEVQCVLEGHTKTIYDGAFHPTENLIVSVSKDGSVIVWDLSTNSKIAEKTLSEEIVTVAFNENNLDEIIYSINKNVVSFWNYKTNKVKRLQGKTSANSLATKQENIPYSGVTEGWRTKILSKEDRQDITYISGKLEQFTFSAQNIGAGFAGSDLYLFQLQKC